MSHSNGASTSSSTSETFPCSWPGCQRAYRRLDHLERHERTHSGDLNYDCRICGKRYGRSDVLNRHLVQTHGEKAASIGRPRKAACIACAKHRLSCDGLPPRPCSRCRKDSQECRYRHLEETEDADRTRSASPRRQSTSTESFGPFSSPSTRPLPEFILGMPGGGTEETSGVTSVDPISLPTISPAQLSSVDPPSVPLPIIDQPPAFDFSLLNDATSATAPDFLTNLFLSATVQPHQDTSFMQLPGAVPSLSIFDWGFTDLDANIFDPIATHAPPTPVVPLEDTGTGHTQDSPEREEHLLVAVSAEEYDGRPGKDDFPDGQPAESSWPSVYKPHTPDTNVHLPAASALSSTDLIVPPGKRFNAVARQVMEKLTLHAHQGIWPTPDLGNFPSEQTLGVCVDLYLSNFASWLPILDSPRGSFRTDKAAPLLLKIVAAVGSIYSREGLERLGMPLAELVRREILFICEHDGRFIYELAIVQASLLQSYFGLFSGSLKLSQHAEISRTSLVSACQKMHLLHARVSAADEVQRAGRGEEDFGRALKQDHRRRRLGWGIFLFDAQLACLFGLPAQYPFGEIDTPLPTVAPKWNPGAPSFSQVLSSLLDDGQLPQLLDDVGYSVVAYSLYRMLLDTASFRSFVPWTEIASNRTFTSSSYRRSPQILLDQLARHTISSASAPTALIVSCSALAYHSRLAPVLPRIKAAAGKFGIGDDVQVARAELCNWMVNDPRAARTLFAHAAMLRCLMSRFIFDTPTELIWLFDATLCLWACLRLSNIVTAARAARTLTKVVTISWSPSSAVDAWIETGEGTASVQGTGLVAELGVRAVLQSSADHLDVLSWGLAKRFRSVVLELLAAEHCE